MVFTTNESRATVKIYWVTSESQADIKVFKVTSESKAKWNKSNPWTNRLG